MEEITLDMDEKSVLLIGKVLDRVKKGVFDVALLCNMGDNEVNEMSSYDVRRFSVNKKILSKVISNSQHPSADASNNDSSEIDINGTSMEYNSDEAIEDDKGSIYNVEEELLFEDKLSSKEDEMPTHEKRGDKVQIRTSTGGTITRKSIFIGCSKKMEFKLHHTTMLEPNLP
eukprot:7684864-Ditylum_brightwellii.AAC.1